jgi:hypothetical protein
MTQSELEIKSGSGFQQHSSGRTDAAASALRSVGDDPDESVRAAASLERARWKRFPSQAGLAP